MEKVQIEDNRDQNKEVQVEVLANLEFQLERIEMKDSLTLDKEGQVKGVQILVNKVDSNNNQEINVFVRLDLVAEKELLLKLVFLKNLFQKHLFLESLCPNN